jgi:chemotaxis protein MotB
VPRKKHEDHDEHVNHEAWVIPYADLLTLLMALFLVLWAMGQTDASKARAISAGFAEELGIGPSGGALGGGGAGNSTYAGTGIAAPQGSTGSDASAMPTSEAKTVANAQGILDQAKQRAADIKGEREELEQTKEEIQKQLDAKGFGDKVQMRVDDEGLVVVATEGLLFGSGSSGLEPSGTGAIDAIAEPLAALTQPIRIEGHTDNTPIASALFPSNWELSTARASVVLRYLLEKYQFPAGRVSAAGYGDTRPVGDNATPEGRSANRRVEIVVQAVKTTAPLPQDGSTTAVDVMGVPAPIGEDGPQGHPDNLGPTTTVATNTDSTTAGQATTQPTEGADNG